jgi:hypothetical protein
MNNIHNNWRKFLTEGSYDESKLLHEVTEDEIELIQSVIDEMGPEDLPFNELFKGKERILIPFAAGDQTTELGQFLAVLSTFSSDNNPIHKDYGFTPNWEKGVMEKEKTVTSKQLANMITGGDAPKKVIESIKIGKWLAAVERAVKDFLEWRIYQGEESIGTAHRPITDEEQVKHKKINDKLVKLLGTGTASGIIQRFRGRRDGDQDERLAEVIEKIGKMKQYWQEQADYIKKNPQGDIDSNTYSIVISRNPVDLLRMSDFRNIESCHSPPSRDSHAGSSYFKCAVAEAHGEGAVAYVVKNEDLEAAFNDKIENITLDDYEYDELFYDELRDTGDVEPISRLRLRLVRHYPDEGGMISPRGRGEDLAVPEEQVYGLRIPGFGGAIMQWAKENQSEQISKITKDGKGTVDFKKFVAMGGSQWDTSRDTLFLKLLGVGRNMKMGYMNVDTSTEDNLEGVGPESEARALESDAREYLAAARLDNFKVEFETDYDEESAWIAPDIRLRFEWDADEWIGLPNSSLLRYIPDELEQFGEVYAFVNDWNPTVVSLGDKIIMHFHVMIDRLHPDGITHFYSAEDFESFLEDIGAMEQYGGYVPAIKHIIELFMKREGYMEGGAIVRLGQEIQSDGQRMLEWDWHVEEGYDDDPIEMVSAESRIWLPYGDIPDEVVKKVFSTREFWLDIRKRMHAPIHEKGLNFTNKYYVDIEKFIGDFDEDTKEVEFKLNYAVGFEDPDDTVNIFQQMIEYWDDEDLLHGMLNTVLQEYAAKVADLTPMEDPESDMNENKKVSGQQIFDRWRQFLG